MNIKIIGAGGIGTALVFPLARYLNFGSHTNVHLTVIDGDSYESKNKDRQSFNEFGNKAQVTVKSLKASFPNLFLKAEKEYVTPDSVGYLMGEDNIIFLCVDNHKTRKLVSEYCTELKNVVLISGGNALTDGNMQIYIRQNGLDITLPISSDFHPEISSPKDKRPDEISCDEQVASEPQLIFTNLTIAVLMLNAFYTYTQNKIQYDEVYADILTNNVRSVQRKNIKLN